MTAWIAPKCFEMLTSSRTGTGLSHSAAQVLVDRLFFASAQALSRSCPRHPPRQAKRQGHLRNARVRVNRRRISHLGKDSHQFAGRMPKDWLCRLAELADTSYILIGPTSPQRTRRWLSPGWRIDRRLLKGGTNEEIDPAARRGGPRAGRWTGHGSKKQLVIVVKGLDNPFFEAIHQGCEKWNSENAESGVRVLLHRPGVDLGRGRRGADHPGPADQARAPPPWPSRRRTRPCTRRRSSRPTRRSRS